MGQLLPSHRNHARRQLSEDCFGILRLQAATGTTGKDNQNEEGGKSLHISKFALHMKRHQSCT
ncbi:MAG: hypothetical protein HC767_02985 [Akkermansiaceae bacterium]|nr:hypothetical protein [Akkermansiaceae bacterium]